jgi:hypothetical protein
MVYWRMDSPKLRATNRVEFLSREWREIEPKLSLEDLILSITRILQFEIVLPYPDIHQVYFYRLLEETGLSLTEE